MWMCGFRFGSKNDEEHHVEIRFPLLWAFTHPVHVFQQIRHARLLYTSGADRAKEMMEELISHNARKGTLMEAMIKEPDGTTRRY